MVLGSGKGVVGYVQQIEGLCKHQLGYSDVDRVNAK